VIRIFPRNEPANPAEYVSERPEMTSHGGRPRKAKTMKGNNNMKMILKNRTALVALLFVLALLLAPKVYASGHFATNYTNASLTGVYGYSTSGEILGPGNPNNNGTNIPVNNAGVMWFDGNGTFEFHDTANVGGNIIQRGTADNPIVGTYTVNPDGTGTMQWFSNGSNHARAFAIVDSGKELQLGSAEGLSIGPGVVGRGVAKKQ